MNFEANTNVRVYPILDCVPIDGDSVRVQLDLGIGLKYEGILRIQNIDAPELEDAVEKDAALVSRKFVLHWLNSQNGPLAAKIVGRDKYGRLLGDIEAGLNSQMSLGCWLLEQGVVRPYDGKKKKLWTLEELKSIASKADLV